MSGVIDDPKFLGTVWLALVDRETFTSCLDHSFCKFLGYPDDPIGFLVELVLCADVVRLLWCHRRFHDELLWGFSESWFETSDQLGGDRSTCVDGQPYVGTVW